MPSASERLRSNPEAVCRDGGGGLWSATPRLKKTSPSDIAGFSSVTRLVRNFY
jgi:hypothetical protein